MKKSWTALIPIVVLLALAPVIAANAQTTVTTTGGTTNSVPKFSGAATIVNSAITESGGNVGIGTTSPVDLLNIYNGRLNLSTDTTGGTLIESEYTGLARITAAAVGGGGTVAIGREPVLVQGQPAGNYTVELWSGTNGGTRTLNAVNGQVAIGPGGPVVSLDLSQDTDALALPVGSSGVRPAGMNGEIRYNTTTSALEAYVNGSWVSITGTGANSGISSSGRLLCGGSAAPCTSSTLSYCPYKGNQKTTALYGNYTIPSGTASSGCLTANLTNMHIGGSSGQSVTTTPTLYYVYLINVSGATYLDLETTGHTTDSATGIEIMSGTNGNKNTLVGMIHTDSNKKVASYGQVVTAGDTNTVATWDNRVPTSTKCGFTANRSQTGTVGYAEINLENRCYFMSWGEAAVFTANQTASNNTSGADCLIFVEFDPPAGPSTSVTVTQTTAAYQMSVLASSSYALAEGYHFTALFGTEQAGSTCTYVGPGGLYNSVYTVQ